MENIIEIDGKRYKVTLLEPELTTLPEKWYTDGTAEANEWAKANYHKPASFFGQGWRHIGNTKEGHSTMGFVKGTYITPAQFNEWVYKPWKESLKPKAPTTIEEFLERVNPVWKLDEDEIGEMLFPTKAHAKSVLALCQLYNVAKRLNECFEADGGIHSVAKDKTILIVYPVFTPAVIIFTSREAAQHAAEHFWHLFADFYMLEDKQ